MKLSIVILLNLALAVISEDAYAEITFDLDQTEIQITRSGFAKENSDQLKDVNESKNNESFQMILKNGTKLKPLSVEYRDSFLHIYYSENYKLTFDVKTQKEFILLKLIDSYLPEELEKISVLNLAISNDRKIGRILNIGVSDHSTIGVLALEQNMRAFVTPARQNSVNKEGCQQSFYQIKTSKWPNNSGARFSAMCKETFKGWVKTGKKFNHPINLANVESLNIWVRGDGGGQLLKIQLIDESGGSRDDYITIDFKGWKRITLDTPIENNIDYSSVEYLNIYYNSLTANQSAVVDLDSINAVIVVNGESQIKQLDNFESYGLPDWGDIPRSLSIEVQAKYGLTPISFAVVGAENNNFLSVIKKIGKISDLPSPEVNGKWLRESEIAKESYLFLRDFDPSALSDVIKFTRKAGVKAILLHQNAWTRGSGHFELDLNKYPNGVDDLRRIVEHFKTAGIRVGFHVLAATIGDSDKYITPIPDKRILKTKLTSLSEFLDKKSSSLYLDRAIPNKFFINSKEVTLILGDELIICSVPSDHHTKQLHNCERSQYGTSALEHQSETEIYIAEKPYGFFMYDQDTTMAQEVAENFSNIANAAGIGMIYIDGAEKLQGPHWYYNSRLVKSIYDRLENKDILIQSSSVSHHSWHMLSRHATADGTGDLKHYLEKRVSRYESLDRLGLPLDFGWYNITDGDTTPDMIEYILGATIGYGASFSMLTSIQQLKTNIFTDDFLSLINEYEKLRLKDNVDEPMRSRLRIRVGNHQTIKNKSEKSDPIRNEFKLDISQQGVKSFERVRYDEWVIIQKLDGKNNVWELEVDDSSVAIGFQVHMNSDRWYSASPAWHANDAISLVNYKNNFFEITSDEFYQNSNLLSNSQLFNSSPGVMQDLKIDSHSINLEFEHYSTYEADNTASSSLGWSIVRKIFRQNIDLSGRLGIGMWALGDGQGGRAKIQLFDGINALDLYIPNNFKGWKYVQFAWPKTHKVELSKVLSIHLGYEGIPAWTKIKMSFSEIKALAYISDPTIENPSFRIGGESIMLEGTLQSGDFLSISPDNKLNLSRDQQEMSGLITKLGQLPRLPKGMHKVEFMPNGVLTSPLRVRTVQKSGESYDIKND